MIEILNRPSKYVYSDKTTQTDEKYLFDGINDSLDISNVKFSGGECTVSLTVRLSAKDNTQLILWENTAAVYNYSLWFNGVDLFFSDDTLFGVLQAGGISLDEDVNITLVYQGNQLTCYINGVLSGGSPIAVNQPTFDINNNTLRIGAGFVANMQGLFDQFLILDKALIQDEVVELYNGGSKLNIDYVKSNRYLVLGVFNRKTPLILGDYDSYTLVGDPELNPYKKSSFFESPVTISFWNAIGGDLPVRYKFRTDLFPLNEADTLYNVLSVQNIRGNSQLTLDAVHSFVIGDYLTVDTLLFSGVYRIIEVLSINTVVINQSYSATTTGNVIKYYNKYAVKVKVFAGLPPNHPLSIDVPMQEVGVVTVTPDINNIADVDITGMAKPFLTENSDLFTGFAPLDYQDFISFYVEYAETYEIAGANGLEQFTSGYSVDTVGGCNESTELLTNYDFSSGLTDWTQTGTGENWSEIGGQAVSNKVTLNETNDLKHLITLEGNYLYTITMDVPLDTNTEITIYQGNSFGRAVIGKMINGIKLFNFYNAGSDYIEIRGRYLTTGTPYDGICKVNSISLKQGDCTIYLWGGNSALPFQNPNGGNLADYIFSQVSNGKFMTDFDKPVYFQGKRFTLSGIIPDSVFSSSYEGDSIFIRIQKDGNSVDRKIRNTGEGVYMIGNTTLENAFSEMVLELEGEVGEFDEAEVLVYSFPDNLFVDADYGTMDYSNAGDGGTPLDWNATILSYDISTPTYASIGITFRENDALTPSYRGNGSMIVNVNTPNGDPVGYELVRFNTQLEVKENTLYKASFKWRDIASTGHDPRLDGIAFLLLLPETGLSTVIDSYDVTRISSDQEGVWFTNSVTFNTGANTLLSFTLWMLKEEVLLGGTGGAWQIDEMEVVGPFEQLSETKTIKIDRECSNQEIYLTWKNTKGGREYFNFTAKKEYSLDLKGETYTKDVFNDWDEYFINGDTEEDYYSIKSRKKVLVRSQLVTKSELDALVGIKKSIRVQEIKDDKLTTVIVDKGSFKIYEDRQKLYYLEFEISYPFDQIQNQ